MVKGRRDGIGDILYPRFGYIKMAGGRLMLARRAIGGRRRLRRARYGGKSKAPHLKGFNRVQARSIVKAIGRKEETKYAATQLLINAALDPSIHSPGVDCVPLVPKIAQGTAENQRIGRKIAPTKCFVDVTATFNQLPVGDSVAIPTAREIYVAMYIVTPKRHKNWQEWATTGNQTLYLLDDGAGNSVPFGLNDGAGGFSITNTSLLGYPVDTSEYRLVKKKVIKLVRNDGFMNAGLGGQTTPNLPQSVWKGRFYFRLPKLIYDDSAAVTGGYPTNSNMVLMFGYCNADNGNTTQPAENYNALSVTARANWYYKDA